MAISVATTTISVIRPVISELDPYDDQPEPEVVATNVRAHISTSTGEESQKGGEKEIVNFRVTCDPIVGGLKHIDTIVDNRNGDRYEVVWAVTRYGFGLDHEQASLQRIQRGGVNVQN